MLRILKKSISILIILSFFINNSFFIAEEITTTVSQSRDDKLSVIARSEATRQSQYNAQRPTYNMRPNPVIARVQSTRGNLNAISDTRHSQNPRNSRAGGNPDIMDPHVLHEDDAIWALRAEKESEAISNLKSNTKLSISKEFSQVQTQAILEEIKEHKNYKLLRVRERQNNKIILTLEYIESRERKIIELRLDQNEEYYSVDISEERQLRRRIRQTRGLSQLVNLLKEIIDKGHWDLVEILVKKVIQKRRPLGLINQIFLEDMSVYLINTHDVQAFIDYKQVWANLQRDTVNPRLPTVDEKKVRVDKRIDVKLRVTEKSYYDLLILLGLICLQEFSEEEKQNTASYLCWNPAGNQRRIITLANKTIIFWSDDKKQEFREIFSGAQITSQSIYDNLKDRRWIFFASDLKERELENMLMVFYAKGIHIAKYIKEIREILGGEILDQLLLKIGHYYSSLDNRSMTKVLNFALRNRFGVNFEYSQKEVEEIRTIALEKIDSTEMIPFLVDVIGYEAAKISAQSRENIVLTKLMIKQMIQEIVEQWDALTGLTVVEKVRNYMCLYFNQMHLSFSEDEDEEARDKAIRRVLDDGQTVVWLLNNIELYDRLGFNEKDLYNLFGNTKAEVLLNLYKELIKFDIDKYKQIILASLNSCDEILIDMYLEMEEQKRETIALDIKNILNVVCDRHHMIEKMFAMLCKKTKTALHRRKKPYLFKYLLELDSKFNRVLVNNMVGLNSFIGEGHMVYIENMLDYALGTYVDFSGIKWDKLIRNLAGYYIRCKEEDHEQAEIVIKLIWCIVMVYRKGLTSSFRDQLLSIIEVERDRSYLIQRIIDIEIEELEKRINKYMDTILDVHRGLRRIPSDGVLLLDRIYFMISFITQESISSDAREQYFEQLINKIVETIIERARQEGIPLSSCTLLKDLKGIFPSKADYISDLLERALEEEKKQRFKNAINRFKRYRGRMRRFGQSIEDFLQGVRYMRLNTLRKERGLLTIMKLLKRKLRNTGNLRIKIQKLKIFQLPFIEENNFIITERFLRSFLLVYELYERPKFYRLIDAMIERARSRNQGKPLSDIIFLDSQRILNDFQEDVIPVLMRLQDIKVNTLEDLIVQGEDYENFWLQVERDIKFLCEATGKNRKQVIDCFPGLKQVFLEENIVGIEEPIFVEYIVNQADRNNPKFRGKRVKISGKIPRGAYLKILTYFNGMQIAKFCRSGREIDEILNVSIIRIKKFESIDFSLHERLLYRVGKLRDLILLVKGDRIIELTGQIGDKVRDILAPVDGEPLGILEQRPLLQSM